MAAMLCLAALPAVAGEIYGMPIYPNTESAPYKGSLSANGVPLEAAVFFTDDPIDKIVAYYRKAIEEQGHQVTEHMFSPGSGYIGYLDMKSGGTMRMATLSRTPQGRTMIVLSNMDPKPLIFPQTVPDDLPALPGATHVVTTGDKAGKGHRRTVSYRVSGMNAKQARANLILQAGEKGWKIDRKEPSFGSDTLVLNRENQVCMVKIESGDTPLNNDLGVSVSMVVFNTNNK
jgi:hypothetical protein